MKAVIVGHSWVARLKDLDLLPPGYRYLGCGGATFVSVAKLINALKPDPTVRAVFLFVGSNDIDSAMTTADVNDLYVDCEYLHRVVAIAFPKAKIVQSQIEDRFAFNHLENPLTIRNDFKRKSNKFNKWLLKQDTYDYLFTLKGKVNFTEPKLYARDGVHLNYDGNLKLADKIVNYTF